MNLLQYVLLGATLIILIALLWVGQRVDRIGAAAFLLVLAISPLLYPLEIGNIRWAVALMSVVFLTVLIALVIASRRWWVVAAAGFQLAATATYAIALAQPELLIWTGVSLRLVLWILQMFACLFGILEAWPHRKTRNPNHRAKRPYPSAEYIR
ncbi:MAG TPA: hypothetical protein VF633_13045 [Brevundimonas sp.]|jgi:hypothetical protein